MRNDASSPNTEHSSNKKKKLKHTCTVNTHRVHMTLDGIPCKYDLISIIRLRCVGMNLWIIKFYCSGSSLGCVCERCAATAAAGAVLINSIVNWLFTSSKSRQSSDSVPPCIATLSSTGRPKLMCNANRCLFVSFSEIGLMKAVGNEIWGWKLILSCHGDGDGCMRW